jgi:hypothetical protein
MPRSSVCPQFHLENTLAGTRGLWSFHPLQSKVNGSMFRLLWTFMAAGIVARGFRSRLTYTNVFQYGSNDDTT